MTGMFTPSGVEQVVAQRYSAGAQEVQPSLCCPVDYDPALLKVIPAEVLERDYGCGDPSRYLEPGETVLDLGCGGGKICFITSQIVGPTGRVTGVDLNDDMLALARGAAPVVPSGSATATSSSARAASRTSPWISRRWVAGSRSTRSPTWGR